MSAAAAVYSIAPAAHSRRHTLLGVPICSTQNRLFVRRIGPRRAPARLRCSPPAVNPNVRSESAVGLSRSLVLEQGEGSEEDFLVISFYKFVSIADPDAEVSKHLSFLQGRDIQGRIYINEQGINAQYSGPRKDAVSYADWIREDSKFSDILVQTSPALQGHAFPRLKLRYKPSLVQLEGGISHLPLLDPEMRATPLAPSEWRKRLQAVNSSEEPLGQPDSSGFDRKLMLLDVRNCNVHCFDFWLESSLNPQS